MTVTIGRRELLAALGGGAAAWPLAVRAQQPGKLPTIGFLGANTRLVDSQRLAAFVERLRELGWIENRTVAIEYRWGEGRYERAAEIAAEFVRLKVDVIVTGGNAAVAAKQASSVVPIVFALASDPVGDGLVASLARPGGNITGLSIQAPDLAGNCARLCLVSADGTVDSQVGARICNGLGIMRACLETLEQLESRMGEIADRVARDRANAARERTSTDEAQRLSN